MFIDLKVDEKTVFVVFSLIELYWSITHDAASFQAFNFRISIVAEPGLCYFAAKLHLSLLHAQQAPRRITQ